MKCKVLYQRTHRKSHNMDWLQQSRTVPMLFNMLLATESGFSHDSSSEFFNPKLDSASLHHSCISANKFNTVNHCHFWGQQAWGCLFLLLAKFFYLPKWGNCIHRALWEILVVNISSRTAANSYLGKYYLEQVKTMPETVTTMQMAEFPLLRVLSIAWCY